MKNPKAVMMFYPGTYIKTRFEGTSLALRFDHTPHEDEGRGNYLGYIIDNEIEGKLLLTPRAGEKLYEITSGLLDRVHDLVLIRRTDFTRGHCIFRGLVLDPGRGLQPPPPRPVRRIECFGDSITAGVLAEACGYEGKEDPPHGNHL